MDINSISRLTHVTVNLNEITSGEVADHLPQFSDVIEKIIEQVLENMGGPGDQIKVDIMNPEQMAIESEIHKHPDEEPINAQGHLYISICETFPCK